MKRLPTPTITALFNLTTYVFDLAEQSGDNRHELRQLHREGLAAQHNLVDLCNAVKEERKVRDGFYTPRALAKAKDRTNKALKRALGRNGT